MLKKAIIFASFIMLASCQSGGGDLVAVELTDQLSGCVMEAVDQKGGSVIIKSPAQYINFESSVNALGGQSELCASDVELPEIDFAESVFIAQTITDSCSLHFSFMETETSLEGDVLNVRFFENMEVVDALDCESYEPMVYAVELKNVPDDVSIVLE